MKVIFHEKFYGVYAGDPAAAPGRMEAIVDVIRPYVDMVEPHPATEDQIAAVHTHSHIERVKRQGVYEVASLAAGGAIKAAEIGLSDSAWGFCYFNNMAIAVEHLKKM